MLFTGSARAQMMALKRCFISSLDPKRGMVTFQSMEYTNVGNLMVAERLLSEHRIATSRHFAPVHHLRLYRGLATPTPSPPGNCPCPVTPP
ncbi:hypothetical protein IMZ11_35595 [Microtetraspora sp. AC03309]|uniref:hypothetical protein n=1 Tax=Microtetraspora sp. AC03309 TaxID=2779376 RepID=UPI001E519A2F|nr:hypothetical protein [Microtetraspora sp. AC03309]MCC5580952.1 hypothetical protein [Microtetraspora sp. AC03309]